MHAQPTQSPHLGPQLTLRAVITGAVLGAVLSACSIYVGLKLGFTPNMSMVAALLGFAFWKTAAAAGGRSVRNWTILENNINQTACSAGASVASAGLAAPIPALALLTGQTLPWYTLAAWLFSVMLIGIGVAVAVRRQMIVVDRLPFAAGVASVELLRQIHDRTTNTIAQLYNFLAGGAIGIGTTIAAHFKYIATWALPGSIAGLPLRSLTFGFNPMPLLIGIGGLVGIRICTSILLGAVIAFGVLAPILINNGLVSVPKLNADPALAQRQLIGAARQWLLWPGVTLMVVASLTSVAFGWRAILHLFAPPRTNNEQSNNDDAADASDTNAASGTIPRVWLALGAPAALILSVALQVYLFHITWPIALFAVLITVALALVTARMAGETSISLSGPMGKITQLLFGAITPHSPTANLMAANVSGGAASQCADLLQDLKSGHILGAHPRAQTIAQIAGAFAGAIAGSFIYLALIPNPQEMLLSAEWPAPGAAAWKAVAELFQDGFDALPQYASTGMLIAAVVAVALTISERTLPPPRAQIRPLPSQPRYGVYYPRLVRPAILRRRPARLAPHAPRPHLRPHLPPDPLRRPDHRRHPNRRSPNPLRNPDAVSHEK